MKTDHADILIKVKELYYKYGIKSVTMEDVARKLGVSKKTLYQCVSDKEDLVQKILALEFNEVSNQIKEICENGENALQIAYLISEKMRQQLSQYPVTAEYDLQKYYPQIYEDFTKQRRKHMINSFTTNMKRGMEEGFFRADLKPEIIARIQVLRLEAKIDDYFNDLKEYKLDQIFYEVFIYHLRGICSQQGIDYLENKILNK